MPRVALAVQISPGLNLHKNTLRAPFSYNHANGCPVEVAACPYLTENFRYNFSGFLHIYSGRRRYRKKNLPSNPTIDPALPCPQIVITSFRPSGICSRPSLRMAPGLSGSPGRGRSPFRHIRQSRAHSFTRLLVYSFTKNQKSLVTTSGILPCGNFSAPIYSVSKASEKSVLVSSVLSSVSGVFSNRLSFLPL